MGGKDTDIARQGRGDRLIKERIHDPYMTRMKLTEPTVCPDCHVVFEGGRWQWMTPVPTGANEELCPACRRIRDRVPAGFLTLSGAFFENHREEILNLMQNKVDAEKRQHPLKRIMGMEEQDEKLVVTFTDTHLPRGVGEAIERAYEGTLHIHYEPEASIIRVVWER
ncbi:MAG: BCAM0308 family protein [Gammaproteobacteria bacterium]